MDKLEKLYTGVFLVFLLLMIYVFYHYYKRDCIADLNNDGVVDQNELAHHIKKEIDERSKNPPGFRGIVKSSLSGAFRGALMGLLLNGVEGAITSAVVLGMINPIVTSVDYML